MSVHSVDRETWLTKLERIGKLSAGDQQLSVNAKFCNSNAYKGFFQ
jgi:hypothetical protein